MTQEVVIRGKKADGTQLPCLVDANGQLQVTGIAVGDVTVGDVTVIGITNKINVDTVDEIVLVDEVDIVNEVVMVTEVDTVNSVTLVDKVTVVDAVTAITDPVDVVLSDEYGFTPEYTPQGEMRTAIPTHLVGANFIGTTVDTNFWTAALGTGGSVAQANNVLTAGVGTNNGNTVTVTSVRAGRFLSNATNRFRGNFRLDSGLLNNARRWGAMSATDGFFFEYDGTSLYIVSRKGSSDTRVAQASWNGVKTFAMDTNFHTYEIYISYGKVMFVIGDDVVHTITPTTSIAADSFNLPIRIENINQVGVSTNKNIYVSNVSIYRMGQLKGESTYKFISGAATTQCKLAAGRIQKVIFNPGANGNTCSIYDATNASNQIGYLIGQANITQQVEYDMPFHTALTIVTVGSSSTCTVVYE